MSDSARHNLWAPMPRPVIHQDRSLTLCPKRRVTAWIRERVGRILLFVIACSSVLAVLLIFLFIIKESIPFLRQYGVGAFLFGRQWLPVDHDHPRFGILALMTGTLYVTLGALCFTLPIGLLTAVFLSEMASSPCRVVIKPLIEILSAIPSVVYGFFAALVLAPWMQNHLGFSSGTNALNAAMILSVMALPTVIHVAENAMSALERDLREASFGLGATRAETVFKVILPAAHRGIIAAMILGMMRAVGETMVVWMASGNASQIPTPWWDLSQSIRTMTTTIASEMGEAAQGSLHRSALFAMGALLLIVTFIMNLTSEYFLKKAGHGASRNAT